MKDPIQYRINKPLPYGVGYVIKHPRTKANLTVIASVDNGWNHVSVSLEKRTPIWDEMCFVKNLFFQPEEMCLQFHPKKSQYVNAHNFCLHIWQPPIHIEQMIEESIK
jgi:hypothetical protein